MVIAIAGSASASTIVNVVFVGAGTTVAGPNNTPVTPYNITINGSAQAVTCYDDRDVVHPGDTWQAYEYTLAEAVSSGMFHTGFGDAQLGYESIGWLSAQTYSTPDEEVALQYAIWNVFENLSITGFSSGQATAYTTYENALTAEKNYVDPVTSLLNPFGNFSFANTKFLEPITGGVGVPGTKQPFVFAIHGGGGNTSSTPEPGTLVMIGSGLLCLLSSLGFKRVAGKKS